MTDAGDGTDGDGDWGNMVSLFIPILMYILYAFILVTILLL